MSDLGLPRLRALYPEKRLEQFTDRTPGTVSELEERVRMCASQGYGSSEGAFERGISVVTAPVRERSGGIVAAVTVTVPRSDFGTAREKDETSLLPCVARRSNYRCEWDTGPMMMTPPRSSPRAAPKKRIERLASRRCATPLATGLERVMDAGEQCHLIAIA
jgi:hypothetical protein